MQTIWAPDSYPWRCRRDDPTRDDELEIAIMGRILLVHFSDIHFGSDFVGTKKRILGLSGHELLLCAHLRAVTRRQGRFTVANDFNVPAEERLHFVLSGDLTRVGSDNDFCLAYQWLLDRWSLYNLVNRPQPFGLEIPPADLYSVPGNHDQWDGKSPGPTNWLSPKSYNPNLVPAWLRPTPWRSAIASTEGDFVLDLFGVDSNSGLPGGRGNLFAEGAISNRQLMMLEREMRQSIADEKNDKIPRMRAIVCHHSFQGQGATAGLRPNSVVQLTRLAYTYNAAAILTGHMHKELHDKYQNVKNQMFWEIRAAAAVQRDPQPALQGFWVHEIVRRRSRFAWNAWQYELGPNRRGFARLPSAIPVR